MEVDTKEYFPATDIHALGQTPSSGMLIQSPDGQPAGIFFKPPASKVAKQTYTSNSPPATKVSERDAMSRPVGNSIETIRNSTRHLSDEVSVPKTLSHPITFRSKTTTAVPGAGVYSPNSPSVPEYVQRRRPSANAVGETNIIRADVSQEGSTPRPADEQEHGETGRVPHKGVLSPPRGRSSIDGQKAATPSRSKLSENTIVPPINVLIVEGTSIN
jgi:osomolarity two-component system response regulator SSK1